MLKLAQTDRQTDQPTNQPTNRQGKNNMSPTTINKLYSCQDNLLPTSADLSARPIEPGERTIKDRKMVESIWSVINVKHSSEKKIMPKKIQSDGDETSLILTGDQ
ncbi:hypothetical protein DPMN_082912 [Dreissena polymorpha]|uniref:Uncharacterized protein n=1 Tax=Dreissena polymorpha TaxID=45954 RepID=A0A9D4BHR4_DREPO|nr:hypothetical protein DPMN_082912 [Dreissena polymorpha]